MKDRPTDHLYVYCAVAGAVPARTLQKLVPMPGASAPRPLPLTPAITLIVSDAPAAAYNAGTIEARLSDLDWVALCGAAHHAVADALAARHVVLPFRLFTLFSSEARAVASLGRRQRTIEQALQRVRGRAEWVLRIGMPDASRVASRPGKRRQSTSSSGTTFLQAKASARRESAERAARSRQHASAVFERLREIADETKRLPAVEGTRLLLEAAFLVPSKRTARMKKALAAAAQPLLDDGCAVSLTGPWPAYSFATIAAPKSHA